MEPLVAVVHGRLLRDPGGYGLFEREPQGELNTLEPKEVAAALAAAARAASR
jgi:hypothetical protein